MTNQQSNAFDNDKTDGFSYKTGGFYVTDDEAGLIHLYYTTKLDDKDTTAAVGQQDEVELHKRHPTAVATTSTIEVGKTILTIKDAFATLKHTTLKKGNNKSTLFIKQLSLLVTDQQDGDLFDRQTHIFKIRVRGVDNEKLSAKQWELFTVTTQYDATDVDAPLPTVTTQMSKDAYGNNSTYLYRGVRTTMYAYDPTSNITYQLLVLSLETVEDGDHSEPPEDN